VPEQAAGVVRLRFEVQDTGPGIASQDIQHIFQPFEQAGPAEQRAAGAGLGLAISRRIVHLMGSDIQVESQPGEGSRFWFDLLLPHARLEGESGPDRPRLVTGYEGSRKSVLVVDDIAANRDLAANALALVGFQTSTAVDGRDALEKLRDGNIDLVVMDVWMPAMDGLEAMRRIRQSPRLAGLPVVAMSASSYHADEDRAFEAGASAFLPKPLDLDRLFEQVGHQLGLTLVRGS
jgi:CheY-like chemotaxis protein